MLLYSDEEAPHLLGGELAQQYDWYVCSCAFLPARLTEMQQELRPPLVSLVSRRLDTRDGCEARQGTLWCLHGAEARWAKNYHSEHEFVAQVCIPPFLSFLSQTFGR